MNRRVIEGDGMLAYLVVDGLLDTNSRYFGLHEVYIAIQDEWTNTAAS